ncbi:CSS motif domain associated with EAL family protein [Pseudomonas putida S610]|uniref:CSS-motif domain-containing protein n=1 Tax=Pseudomonas putida group TaxID=136845 RepID=UPI0003C63D61|nr:CSS-motif domain-containing protein [Pseudomonas putida]EST14369.1 CSS motif domain associated with EAL family protein [Pseudomonas putida S610]
MDKFMHAGRSLLELVLLMAVGLVPVFSGLLVINYQQEAKLEDNAEVSVREAVFSVDQALYRVHEVAMSTLLLAGQPCSRIRRALVDQVTSRSMLRSLAVIEDGKAYCSSASDPLKELTEIASTGQLLTFDPLMVDAQGHLLMNMHVQGEKTGVIATSFPLHLRTELDAFKDGLTLILEFDEHAVWKDGDSLNGTKPSVAEFTHELRSTKYPYRVVAGYPAGYAAQELRTAVFKMLPSLMLVGLMTGSVIYVVLGKMRVRQRNSAVDRPGR